MPDKTAPDVDWDSLLTVTARRGDIAAAAQALGYANNPSEEAMAFQETLRAALSQPEHQGEEEVFEQAVHDAAVALTETLNPHLTGDEWNDEISALSSEGIPEALRAALSRLRPQPPAPVLSDEEREQIEEAFEELAGYVPAGRKNLNLKILRNLASREQGGEEDGNWYFDAPPEDERADGLVAALRDLDATMAKLPLDEQRRYRECEESVLRARGFTPSLQPPAGEVEGEADETPQHLQLDNDEIQAGARNIPRGDVEGLRERLLEEVEKARQWKISETERVGPALSESEATEGIHVLSLADFNTTLDKVFPPPSDSQGEQGRCGADLGLGFECDQPKGHEPPYHGPQRPAEPWENEAARAIVERLIAGLRQVAGPRTDEAVNVPVAVQNVHLAADLLEAQLRRPVPDPASTQVEDTAAVIRNDAERAREKAAELKGGGEK